MVTPRSATLEGADDDPLAAVTIRLPPLQTLLTDGVTRSRLSTTDPPAYVGERYESDYSWKTLEARRADSGS